MARNRHPATKRRLAVARQAGYRPHTPLLSVTLLSGAFALGFPALGEWVVVPLRKILVSTLREAGSPSLASGTDHLPLLGIVLIPMGVIFLCLLAADALQGGLRVRYTSRFHPPRRPLLSGGPQLARGLTLLLVLAAFAGVLLPFHAELTSLWLFADPSRLLALVGSALRVCAAMVFLLGLAACVLDVVYLLGQWRASLRMSDQEIQDERRRLEGNPAQRRYRRRLWQASVSRLRRRPSPSSGGG